jgi:hypothetical protein
MKNKPPTFGRKNSMTGQHFSLLTPRTPSSLNVAKDVDPEMDWGEGLSFTPEPCIYILRSVPFLRLITPHSFHLENNLTKAQIDEKHGLHSKTHQETGLKMVFPGKYGLMSAS